MRFHLGAIPETPDFRPEAPWRPLREPAMWVMQCLALPVGIAVAAGVAVLWITTTPLGEAAWKFSAPAFLFSFAGIVVVHELIHAAAHPSRGRSQHSIFGFWPKQLAFYAAYTGELTRNRFIAILLMPLVVISFVPLLVAAALQMTSPWLAFVSVFNALLACGDIIGAGIIWWQIPATAILRNLGFRTYWREETSSAEQDGTGQPATRSQSKSEGSDKPQPEEEGRSR